MNKFFTLILLLSNQAFASESELLKKSVIDYFENNIRKFYCDLTIVKGASVRSQISDEYVKDHLDFVLDNSETNIVVLNDSEDTMLVAKLLTDQGDYTLNFKLSDNYKGIEFFNLEKIGIYRTERNVGDLVNPDFRLEEKERTDIYFTCNNYLL